MATPTAEYCETLVAQGYSETVADAIIAVAGAARDEAVEQAAERNGHMAAMLNTRLDDQAAKHDSDLRSVESAIRETVTAATTELKDELTKEQVLNERRLREIRAGNDRLFRELRAEHERRFNQRRFGGIRVTTAKLTSPLLSMEFALGTLILGCTGLIIATIIAFNS